MLYEKVKETIKQYNMLKNGDNILIGLSGGADSVSLLLCMIELRTEYNLKISAVHINHCLRGEESDGDEEFCSQLCKNLNIPFFSERLNVIKFCNKNGFSIEEGARILRYEIFKKYCNDGKIATAHTLSDNAETVLHNLTRGSGLKGILGIPPKRDNIIRPLIGTTRKEVEEYLDSKHQNFVTDKTNLCDDYTRNKIRHNVIPILESINPSFLNTMHYNISALSLENSFIEEQVNETYKKCFIPPNKLIGLQNYHKALRNRCIAKFLNDYGLSYSFDKINSVDDILMSQGKINIAKDVYIISKMGTISIERILASQNTPFSTSLEIGDNHFISCKTLNAQIINKNDLFSNNDIINTKFANSIIDYDKIQGKAILRTRKFGDKIQLSGRNFTSSVKKLLNENISSNERNSLCFISDDEGVIYIEKIGVADRVKVDLTTTSILKITVESK